MIDTGTHYTVDELLMNIDRETKPIVVIGTGEETDWQTYTDSFQHTAPRDSCTKITSDSELGLLRSFSTLLGNYQIYLLFSNSCDLPALIKQMSDCWIHQVQFHSGNSINELVPPDVRLPEANSYEAYLVEAYHPGPIDKVWLSISIRHVIEASNEFQRFLRKDLATLTDNERAQLIAAYETATTLGLTEVFSQAPWQYSDRFGEIEAAWEELRSSRVAMWEKLGEVQPHILIYMELLREIEQSLQWMQRAGRWSASEAAQQKVLSAPLLGQSNLDEIRSIVDRSREIDRRISQVLEADDQKLGVKMASEIHSDADDWTNFLIKATTDVYRMAVVQIQLLKDKINELDQMLSQNKN